MTRLENPFPGLRTFDEEDDYLFFGRDEQIDELVQRLGHSRFLAVVGASGSGKSSLVRAGLLPLLRAGEIASAGTSWRVATMRPGTDPIGALARALNGSDALGSAPEGQGQLALGMLDAHLRTNSQAVVESVLEARLGDDENVLIVVDQFEELFRFTQSTAQISSKEDVAQAFVKLLLSAAKHEAVSVYVVLTMRSDFIGHCASLSGLAEAVNGGQYLVPRLDRDAQREAICAPVAVAGAKIAPRLVQRLLNEIDDDPDQLPVLQHALMRTWNMWEARATPGEALDIGDYLAAGTMEGALCAHAEEAYLGLSERHKKLAKRLLQTLTDGSENRRTRRPKQLRELCEVSGAEPADVTVVVDAFRDEGRSFLMPPQGTALDSKTVIDISHESLMRVWKRLRSWVDEESKNADAFFDLCREAQGKLDGRGELLQGVKLQLALEWRSRCRPTVAWGNLYDPRGALALTFLNTSEAEREQEEYQERQVRRAQLIRLKRALGASVAVAMTVIAGGLYVVQSKANEQESKVNEQVAIAGEKEARESLKDVKRLVAAANKELKDAENQKQQARDEFETVEISLKKARKNVLSAKSAAKDAAEEAERKTAAANRLASRARQKADDATALATDAIAAAAKAKDAQARAAEQVLMLKCKAFRNMLLREGRTLLANGLADQADAARAYRLFLEALRLKANGVEELGGVSEPCPVSAVADAPTNGSKFVLGLYQFAKFSEIRGDAEAVSSGSRVNARVIEVSDDGSSFSVGLSDGRRGLLASGKASTIRIVAKEERAAVRAMSTSKPFGTAFGFSNGVVRVVPQNASESIVLRPQGALVRALGLLQGGTQVVVGSWGDGLELWSLKQLKPKRLGPEINRVGALQVVDRWIIAGTNDGLRIWDATDHQMVASESSSRQIVQIATFRRESGRIDIAAGYDNGQVGLWKGVELRVVDDSIQLPEPRWFASHEAAVTGLEFTRHGQLISSSTDRSLHIIPVDNERLASRIGTLKVPIGSWIWDVAVDHQRERLLVATQDKGVLVVPLGIEMLLNSVSSRELGKNFREKIAARERDWLAPSVTENSPSDSVVTSFQSKELP